MTRTTRGHGRPINVQRSTFNVQRLTTPTSPATCHLPPATLTLSVPLDANGAIPTHAMITALLTLNANERPPPLPPPPAGRGTTFLGLTNILRYYNILI